MKVFVVVFSLMVCGALSVQPIKSDRLEFNNFTAASVLLQKKGKGTLHSRKAGAEEREEIPFHVDNQDNIYATLGAVFTMNLAERFKSEWDNQEVVFTADGIPPGLHLGDAGILHGIPIMAGEYPLEITATDDRGENSTSSAFEMHINTYGSNVLDAFCDIGCVAQTSGDCQEAVRGNNRCWGRQPNGICPQGSIDCTQRVYEKNLDLIEFNTKFTAVHDADFEDLDEVQEMGLVQALARNTASDPLDIRIIRILVKEKEVPVEAAAFLRVTKREEMEKVIEYDVDFAIVEPDSEHVMHVINAINAHDFRHNLALDAASAGIPIDVDTLDMSDIEIDFLTGEDLTVAFSPESASVSVSPEPSMSTVPALVLVAAPAPAPAPAPSDAPSVSPEPSASAAASASASPPNTNLFRPTAWGNKHHNTIGQVMSRRALHKMRNPGVPEYVRMEEPHQPGYTQQFSRQHANAYSESDSVQYYTPKNLPKGAKLVRSPPSNDKHSKHKAMLDHLLEKYD